MGETDWVKVVEAVCSVVTTYIAIEQFRDERVKYREKVYDIMDKAIIKRAEKELALLTDMLRKTHKQEIAEKLETLELESEYGQIILKSYIDSQKVLMPVIEQSYAELGFVD
ncbi:MAG: hypothetical protein H6Q74_264 [Firmicutes bacterium]|nr:hypothetical protein [Bacillota bacterium]